ncbi:sugar ABC transporter permease [Erwinia sp. OLTSP20]|nr:sugar ABC transporter permease [Erwinia sp. OAMSP11]PIJ71929.1 sugar ABC transporter permease [Erwinia sp. OLSSP12]PIJ81131.1 sugar ABC transporter permease [Erwinia sp. OLCASP19]PIJ83561.1 sugar ABC transporter permease [Erwinia sp. OLMTSP26]PIJ86176.1 sugar ABC transporter permease [Erwinia sp. OLMDSP33]PIJ89695.1 sugar ABC transporter permease [Erwinia sp. OLFS4]PIJ92299.1 sugar ABC transporter permease [Erwinia sp. OLTSP20]
MASEKNTRRKVFSLSDWMLPLLVVVVAVVTGIIQPRFLSVSNGINLACQLAPLLIISLGQAVAVIRGGLDLSLSSAMSLAGVAGVMVMNQFGVSAGLVTMLLTGTLTGAVSGMLISFFNTSPLVITLGMLSVAQAFALILSGGVPIYDVPAAYIDAVGYGTLLGLPVMVWIAFALTAVIGLLLKFTLFGRYVYAMGSNVSAASKSGINVRFNTVLVYMVSGFCAGTGAIVLTAWTSSAQPIAAANMTLQSLAAVVLGGVALTGGAGDLRQVITGVVVLTLLSNVMNMVGVSAYYQTLAVGVVIILAVILDRFRRRESH